MVFIPPGQELPACAAIESAAARSGLRCLGWRVVPTSPELLGPSALGSMPLIRQCFFESKDPAADLERQLYLIRKHIESRASPGLYFCSLSSRTLVYKGLLTPLQLRAFYPISPPMISPRPSRFFTSATPPTPAPPGNSRSPSVTSRTTAKSIPSAPIAAGPAPVKAPPPRIRCR